MYCSGRFKAQEPLSLLLLLQATLRAYPWHRHTNQTVVDVGGGTGDLLAALLQRYPSVGPGVLFDLPSVLEAALSAGRDAAAVHSWQSWCRQGG